MTRKISKIKYTDGLLEIEIQEAEGTREEESKYRNRETPRPELDKTLQALKPEALKICELPDDYGKNMRVSGVSLSHKQDVMGATITLVKKLTHSNTPFVINTPFLPSEPYNHADQNAPTLSTITVKLIETLVDEAEEYIDGDRAQMEMTVAKPETKKKNKK